MKRLFFLIAAFLYLNIQQVHAEFMVDGIYYEIQSEFDKKVYVTSYPDGHKYSGSVTIPSSVSYNGEIYSVTDIEGYAFSECSGLTSITIPNSVTSIYEGAFYGCSSLTSVTIPNSVTSIGEYAFSSCISLTSVKVASGNPVYDSRDNCNAIIETATNTLISGCKSTVIPNSVTSIGSSAFSYCSSLTSVTIPNSVTSIGKYAFSGCI